MESLQKTPEDKADQNKELGKLSFEAAIEKLQITVKKIESGELSLEQSLAYFEEGMLLTRACQEHLNAAEQRVEILMKSSNGQSELQPFNIARN